MAVTFGRQPRGVRESYRLAIMRNPFPGSRSGDPGQILGEARAVEYLPVSTE